ncbi:selenide,water dikinase [Ochrobactrum sp. P6BSIII]|uniref:selenide, water dikinase SelD n=1 Tax=unclassified Ochrobactrum TaxID=239106 RepID=UPI0009921BCE|nr:selenide,water dikinase [Ochrobactrum sp. P6BSIII]
MDIASPIRLSTLAHGGGCGCKLAPAVLQNLLADQPAIQPFKQLLVGTETGDDAAVWQLDDENCVIATTDFFMPMVDDPVDFGRIAATNAISDVYAMGGTPIMALAILGMPVNQMPAEMIRDILKGGSSICAEAGIPVAGGHSIDTPEPIYGLAVIGTCKLSNLRKNSGAKPGDVLILTKGLGVGIYSAAFKKQVLDSAGYDEMMASVTLLNRVGAELGKDEAVHAVTDVTGFGILGHALEMARGSKVGITLRYSELPLLGQAARLAEEGFITGASTRNWASYDDEVHLADDTPLWKQQLLTDPQTSGGLLVSCAPDAAERILATIHSAGYPAARVIGAVGEAPSVVTVVD